VNTTVKFPFLALLPLALLAACGGDAPTDDGRAASGEVLEGTISDAMLPLDRVQSEPPLEDPEAFAEARSADGEDEAGTTPDAEEQAGSEPSEADQPDPEPAPEAGDE
jgi:hypothetical protein